MAKYDVEKIIFGNAILDLTNYTKQKDFEKLLEQTALMQSFVDSTADMVDTSKKYVLKSTGTVWEYKETTTEQEVTVTDKIEGTEANPYHDDSRLGSDGSAASCSGYVITPKIDFNKYNGKTIELHLDGCRYITETQEIYIMYSLIKEDDSVYAGRIYSQLTEGSQSIYNINEVTKAVIHSDTSSTLTMTPPLTYASGHIAFRYMRFCGKGQESTSNIYITYKTTEKVSGGQWVDTGVAFGYIAGGDSTIAKELESKVAELCNKGPDPETVKLLSAPVLDFYNKQDYPDDDYTITHLRKITYPCRADIPVPYTVKWEHNEDAMRTIVAVDTKAIDVSNKYSMVYYDATGLDSYPLYNLIPNKTYFYKVTHVLADGSLVEAKSGSFKTSSEFIRLLYIDGTQNVRDLGGWTGLDGKKVKYGKIIRGASLSDSSSNGLCVTGRGRLALAELNIQAELNLGAVDSETNIAANCDYKKIYYSSYATAVTDSGARSALKNILEVIVAWLELSKNIYMHCQGGCDRTGTLSFIILGLLGVSESDLAKEYELSSFSSIGFNRLRNTTKAVDVYDYSGMVSAIKGYAGDSFNDKIYNFVTTDCEVATETIKKMREILLE